MAKLFDSIQRFRKIEEVCSTQDVLPPVYLMDEIVEQAKESQDSAQSVAEHVNRNLVHKNPVVKWKALKLTKHLCNKSCLQFQRAMQRYASVIRELIHYKGEPDPFKGDANNQRVRDLAKEVVEVLYAHAAQPAGASGGLQGRIQGFGSSSSMASSGGGGGGGGGFSASSNSRMMAFGSSTAPPPSSGGVGGFMGNLQTAVMGGVSGGGGHSRNGSLGEPVLGAKNSSGGSMFTSSAAHTASSTAAGTRGGSFGPSGGTFGPIGGGGGGGTGSRLSAGTYTGVTESATSGSDGGRAGGGGGRLTGGVLGGEQALVDNICSAGGLRVQPNADELRSFVQAVSASDGLKVAELMQKKLASDQWQVVLRTLYALEAILDQGMTQACGEVAVMFQSEPTPVYAAASATQPQVRTQAAKVLKLLTGEDVDVGSGAGARTGTVAQPAPATATPAATQPAAAVDLLGDLFGGDMAAPAAAPAAPAATQPAAPAASAQQDPFAVLAALTPPPVTATSSNPGASVPAVPLAAAPATDTRPPLDDLFASMAVSSAAPPAGAPQHTMPAGLTQPYSQLGGTLHGMTGQAGMAGFTPGFSQQGAPAGGLHAPGVSLGNTLGPGAGQHMGLGVSQQQAGLGAMGQQLGMGFQQGGAAGMPGSFGMGAQPPAGGAYVGATSAVGLSTPTGYNSTAGKAPGSAANDAAFDFVKAAFK